MGDLQEVIKAIPIAEDGHVISKDYHNSLRTAVSEIARLAFDGSQDREESVTLAPSFQAYQPNTQWVINAISASSQSSSDGWLPVILPDGSRIQRLIAVVGRTGTSTNDFSFTINLFRQPFAAPNNPIQIASIKNLAEKVNEDSDPFEAEARVVQKRLVSEDQNESLKTVDNKKYRYFVQSRVVNLPTGTNVKIYGIRIEFLR